MHSKFERSLQIKFTSVFAQKSSTVVAQANAVAVTELHFNEGSRKTGSPRKARQMRNERTKAWLGRTISAWLKWRKRVGLTNQDPSPFRMRHVQCCCSQPRSNAKVTETIFWMGCLNVFLPWGCLLVPNSLWLRISWKWLMLWKQSDKIVNWVHGLLSYASATWLRGYSLSWGTFAFTNFNG